MEVAVAQMRGKGKVGDPPACSLSSLPDPSCYIPCVHISLLVPHSHLCNATLGCPVQAGENHHCVLEYRLLQGWG